MLEIRLRSLTGLLKFGSKNEESPLSTAMVLSFPILHRIVQLAIDGSYPCNMQYFIILFGV